MMHMKQLHQVLVSCMFVHIDEFAFVSCVLNTVCLGKLCPKCTSWLCRKKKNKHGLFLVKLYFPRHCQGGSPHKCCSLTRALMILIDFFKIHFSWRAVFVVYNLPAINFSSVNVVVECYTCFQLTCLKLFLSIVNYDNEFVTKQKKSI